MNWVWQLWRKNGTELVQTKIANPVQNFCDSSFPQRYIQAWLQTSYYKSLFPRKKDPNLYTTTTKPFLMFWKKVSPQKRLVFKIYLPLYSPSPDYKNVNVVGVNLVPENLTIGFRCILSMCERIIRHALISSIGQQCSWNWVTILLWRLHVMTSLH